MSRLNLNKRDSATRWLNRYLISPPSPFQAAREADRKCLMMHDVCKESVEMLYLRSGSFSLPWSPLKFGILSGKFTRSNRETVVLDFGQD